MSQSPPLSDQFLETAIVHIGSTIMSREYHICESDCYLPGRDNKEEKPWAVEE